MLVNGEFGRRIAKQAHRHNMNPVVLEWVWGEPWDLAEIAEVMDDMPVGSWVWGVHQESSTGMMNDLPGLVELAGRRGIRVCADCVSSLGAVPVDLSRVYLATGTTGKALSSYAGIGLVFADPDTLTHLSTDRVPSYLDLPATLASSGPRFTVPSPLLKALSVALRAYSTPEKAQAGSTIPPLWADTSASGCATWTYRPWSTVPTPARSSPAFIRPTMRAPSTL